MPFTASWWTSAPRRPRRVAKPWASICNDLVELGALADRGRDRRGGTSSKSSSSAQSSAAVSATICCASTSSGLLPDDDPVQLSPVHRTEEGGALDQLVAGEREEPALRRAVHGVPRAADPLEEGGDAARRAQLADEIDMADVDAELQRGGGDQRLELPRLEPLLRVEPGLLGQAAVVRGHRVLAQPLGEVARDPLRQAAGVHEDERGPVRLDQLGQPVVDLVPDLARHDRLERRAGQLERRGRVVRRWPASMMTRTGGLAGLEPAAATSSIGLTWRTGQSAEPAGAATWLSRSSVRARCAPRRDSTPRGSRPR